MKKSEKFDSTKKEKREREIYIYNVKFLRLEKIFFRLSPIEVFESSRFSTIRFEFDAVAISHPAVRILLGRMISKLQGATVYIRWGLPAARWDS